MITGDFNHGNMSEISAILSSYSADVITELPDSGDRIDCIVVGDRKENINGHAVKEAQKSGVPIFTETEFFSRYEIDADMAANL